MAYATLLNDDMVDAQYLAVLKPRRRVTSGWTSYMGAIYQVSFDYGEVWRIEVNGVLYPAGADRNLAEGYHYWDRETKTLYVRIVGGDDPNSAEHIIVFYELHVGTIAANFHRIPTDSTSAQVHFDGCVLRYPNVIASMSDAIMGFLPVQSGQLALANDDQFLNRHLHDSSFNKAPLNLYRVLGGKLRTENIQLVFRGVVGNVTFSDDQVAFQLNDQLDMFDKEYRPGVSAQIFIPNGDGTFRPSVAWTSRAGEPFITLAAFPDVDPNYIGTPMRHVYGYVDGAPLINLKYVQKDPTTANNRDWLVSLYAGARTNFAIYAGKAGKPDPETGEIPIVEPNTTTKTFCDGRGIQAGDTIKVDTASGWVYLKVTAGGMDTWMNGGYIEHEAISSPLSGGIGTRSTAGYIHIIHDDVIYKAWYGRDYEEISNSDGSIAIRFNSSMETNTGLPATLSPNDRVYARVYGGPLVDFGERFPQVGKHDDAYQSATDPVLVLMDLILHAGYDFDEIDQDSFVAARGILEEGSSPNVYYPAIGFAIPESVGDNYPTLKDVIGGILRTILGRLYINDHNKWALEIVRPFSDQTLIQTATDADIQISTFEYLIDYRDIASEIVVEYARREIAEDLAITGSTASYITKTSNVAKYLHNVRKQKTFKAATFDDETAEKLANRLKFIYGERQGVVTFKAGQRFMNSMISDRVAVSREKLPGYSQVAGTDRTRDLSVIETSKTVDSVEIRLDDQKGIEDNAGAW